MSNVDEKKIIRVATMSARVSIVKCEDYTPSNVLRAVKEAVSLLGGMEKFVRQGQKVLLKPNLLSARPPESGVCTHPAVVEAIISLATAAGGICTVGDSPSVGANTQEGFENLLKVTGMMDVIRRTEAGIAWFNKSGTERRITNAKVFRRILIADALAETDVLINVPKFKTHELTRLTGAVKNLFGCIPGRRKVEFHLQAGADPEVFAQILVDTLWEVRPALNIMDGIVGMDGQGPAAGRRRIFGFIIAGEDPVAVDAVACITANIDPMEVPMLRLATEQGVGTANRTEIEILGVQPEEVRIPGFLMPGRGDIISRLPRSVYHIARNHLVKRPVFIRSKCTGCRECVAICPVGAIHGNDKKLAVDYSTCIRCYCCQEVCPAEAIALRDSRLRVSLETALAIRRAIRRILKK
ncbi:MAG: DUF362 domain-containing protein [Armatimonadota bacterium]|nr:DUF362 domain-containing protein [Armatimonadota bacterium]